MSRKSTIIKEYFSYIFINGLDYPYPLSILIGWLYDIFNKSNVMCLS